MTGESPQETSLAPTFCPSQVPDGAAVNSSVFLQRTPRCWHVRGLPPCRLSAGWAQSTEREPNPRKQSSAVRRSSFGGGNFFWPRTARRVQRTAGGYALPRACAANRRTYKEGLQRRSFRREAALLAIKDRSSRLATREITKYGITRLSGA